MIVIKILMKMIMIMIITMFVAINDYDHAAESDGKIHAYNIDDYSHDELVFFLQRHQAVLNP